MQAAQLLLRLTFCLGLFVAFFPLFFWIVHETLSAQLAVQLAAYLVAYAHARQEQACARSILLGFRDPRGGGEAKARPAFAREMIRVQSRADAIDSVDLFIFRSKRLISP